MIYQYVSHILWTGVSSRRKYVLDDFYMYLIHALELYLVA